MAVGKHRTKEFCWSMMAALDGSEWMGENGSSHCVASRCRQCIEIDGALGYYKGR